MYFCPVSLKFNGKLPTNYISLFSPLQTNKITICKSEFWDKWQRLDGSAKNKLKQALNSGNACHFYLIINYYTNKMVATEFSSG